MSRTSDVLNWSVVKLINGCAVFNVGRLDKRGAEQRSSGVSVCSELCGVFGTTADPVSDSYLYSGIGSECLCARFHNLIRVDYCVIPIFSNSSLAFLPARSLRFDKLTVSIARIIYFQLTINSILTNSMCLIQESQYSYLILN